MACQKTLSLSLKEDDSPLDQAIYSSANGAIYAVGGQRVYKYNATTGAKIAEAVVAPDGLGRMSICDHSGTLYVTVCFTQTDPPPAGTWRNHDFFTINPTTLVATNTNNWKTYWGGVDNGLGFFGPVQAVSDGTRLWGTVVQNANTLAIYFADPTNFFATFNARNLIANSSGSFPFEAEVIWESVNSIAIVATAHAAAISGYDMSGGFPPTSVAAMAGGFALRPHGLCYCPSNNKIYAVDGTSILISASVADMLGAGGINAPINTGEAAANPRRIKYCALDGYIYVPGWNSNSIIVINPATDTVVATKTGFNLPWDIVITGSKKFAVQNSGQGLKEIT